MMPLAHAHDALADEVSHFHNDCLRRGIVELSPKQWVDEFRLWLDGYEFERQYAETLKWLDATPPPLTGAVSMGSFDEHVKGQSPTLDRFSANIARHNEACRRRAAAAPIWFKFLAAIGYPRRYYEWQQNEPIWDYYDIPTPDTTGGRDGPQPTTPHRR